MPIKRGGDGEIVEEPTEPVRGRGSEGGVGGTRDKPTDAVPARPGGESDSLFEPRSGAQGDRLEQPTVHAMRFSALCLPVTMVATGATAVNFPKRANAADRQTERLPTMGTRPAHSDAASFRVGRGPSKNEPRRPAPRPRLQFCRPRVSGRCRRTSTGPAAMCPGATRRLTHSVRACGVRIPIRRLKAGQNRNSHPTRSISTRSLSGSGVRCSICCAPWTRMERSSMFFFRTPRIPAFAPMPVKPAAQATDLTTRT